MKNIFVIDLSISMINICKGQNTYIPLVKENSFCIKYNFYNVEPYPKSTGATLSYFKGDSIIDGKVYGKAYSSNLAGIHNCPLEQRPCFVADYPYKPIDKYFVGLYRDDTIGRKVFYKQQENVEEVELYNFALSKGDTISDHLKYLLPSAYNGTGIYDFGEGIIDSTAWNNINGKVTKVLYLQALSEYYPFKVYIEVIEGIGLKCDYCEGTLADCNIVSSTKNTPDTPSNKIEIFPNPTSDYIILRSPTSISKVEIFDQNNRIVISSQSLEIDVNSLISGVYFVKCITSNNFQYYQKFIKI